MDYATKFHQNFDIMYIVKVLDQDLSQQLSRASSLLSPILVVSDGKCPRAILLQPAFLVKESNWYQGAIFCCVKHDIHFGFVTEISKI